MAPSATIEECCIDATAPLSEILAVLKKQGGIVLKGCLSPEDCAKMKAELQPHIDAQNPKFLPPKPVGDVFFPETTRKVGALVTKSETYATKYVLNPVILGIANSVLTIRHPLWMGEERKWCRTGPQINVTAVMEIHPGAHRQPFHRDDYTFNRWIAPTDEWTQGRDLSILAFVALSKVTPENGGTLWIPGSHLTGEEYTPNPSDALQATMDIGDVFIFLCSTFHAGGANALPEGAPDSVRTIAGLGFSSANYRQEENQYLALDHEKLKQLPVEVQKLAGWDIAQPNVGSVNFQHPLNLLGHTVPYSDECLFEADTPYVSAVGV